MRVLDCAVHTLQYERSGPVTDKARDESGTTLWSMYLICTSWGANFRYFRD